MAKRTLKIEVTEADQRKMMARMNWERSVSEMAEGRRMRATTFTDRRKKESHDACRNHNRQAWF
jgi:hypothetical protein|tara:strand:+ start:216 stop:407 length:192 start_codon:yes stop_codon:yes gene_type:complete